MKNRQIHEHEVVILSGPVKIEDRSQAEKGNVLLKERWAVLCPSRLLLFKSERYSLTNTKQAALAVYPLNESNFELRSAATLTEYNFQNRRPFEDQSDSLDNYQDYIRMTFVRSVDKNLDSRISKERRDFYFGSTGNRNEEWLKALKMAKKQYQDKVNRSHCSKQSSQVRPSTESSNFSKNPYRPKAGLRTPTRQSQVLRQSEQSYVARILNQFSNYLFNGCCECQTVRESQELRMSVRHTCTHSSYGGNPLPLRISSIGPALYEQSQSTTTMQDSMN